MKLFIDTSNSYFIAAIVHNNKVTNFIMKKSNKNMAKMGNVWLDEFLNSAKLQPKDLTGYLLTNGPGSFTGVKVGLNIIKSFNLVKEVNYFGFINTFDLLKTQNSKYVILPIGKSKKAIKKYGFLCKSIKVRKNNYKLKIPKNKKITNGYLNFNKDHLQEKINQKSFKVVDNLNNIKLIYLNSKVGK